uniref:Protein kinase domain-containing protein n=1 Tax=Palpitomonas bilix TaxID=652834 RepID=A0A7S3GB17_9EUKA|mmetsp:Transcript_34724/g.90050  ORF Transcript_34724/g.90050 Transcript_34724/m.90050 type:complete len:253 (+) Transcript_34724:250-1008(+)
MGCGASSQFQRLHGGESLDITPKESNVQGNGRARRRMLAQSETVDAPSRLRQRNPPGLRKAVLMREPSDLIDADKVGELPNLPSTKKSNLVEAAVSYAHTSPAHFDGRQQMKSIRLWRGKLEDAGLKKITNLGQGIHGWVDLVFDAREKRVFAAKTIYLDRVFATPNDLSRRGSIKNRNLKKAALSEVPEARLLRNLRHPNVVQLHRVLEAYDRVTLILDYAEGGDLASWMKNTGPVGEGVAAKLMAGEDLL